MIPIDELIKFTGFTQEELSTRSRKREHVTARWIVIDYLLKHGYNTITAGAVFNRHHSSVSEGMRCFKTLSWVRNRETLIQIEAFQTNLINYMNITTPKKGFYPFVYELAN